jgi:hypothetical protein
MDGPEGFDLSKGTWRRDGWKELDELRKKLEDLKELRELVGRICSGRAGGVAAALPLGCRWAGALLDGLVARWSWSLWPAAARASRGLGPLQSCAFGKPQLACSRSRLQLAGWP